jgi:hypothetical protein
MSRYIKAADVEDVRMCLHKILGAVSQAPSIDIVRCKECKHRESCCRPCYKSADSYCSDGEREDEPQTCEECEHWNDTEDGCADRHGCKIENCSEKPNNCEDLQDWKDRMWAEAIVTEPTISKMEQVEDETRLTAKCLNCANGGSYKCSKCDGEMYYKYDKDEPQTDCEACELDGKADVCKICRVSDYEPQTDCPWK